MEASQTQSIHKSPLEGLMGQIGAELQELLTLGETVERRFKRFTELSHKLKEEYGGTFEGSFAPWMQSGYAAWLQLQKDIGKV